VSLFLLFGLCELRHHWAPWPSYTHQYRLINANRRGAGLALPTMSGARPVPATTRHMRLLLGYTREAASAEAAKYSGHSGRVGMYTAYGLKYGLAADGRDIKWRGSFTGSPLLRPQT